MNIYQKLIEVRKACPYLKKDNKGYQFQYVSSSQTLGTLRAAMDENALLLVPCVNSYEVLERATKNGGKENFTLLDMTFTWVNADNPEEKIECPWTGQGLDSGEKGVGKALTYAEKYFLLKFFNIATDKDDPDAFQGKSNPPKQQNTERDKQAQTYKKLLGQIQASKKQGDAALTSQEITTLPKSGQDKLQETYNNLYQEAV